MREDGRMLRLFRGPRNIRFRLDARCPLARPFGGSPPTSAGALPPEFIFGSRRSSLIGCFSALCLHVSQLRPGLYCIVLSSQLCCLRVVCIHNEKDISCVSLSGLPGQIPDSVRPCNAAGSVKLLGGPPSSAKPLQVVKHASQLLPARVPGGYRQRRRPGSEPAFDVYSEGCARDGRTSSSRRPYSCHGRCSGPCQAAFAARKRGFRKLHCLPAIVGYGSRCRAARDDLHSVCPLQRSLPPGHHHSHDTVLYGKTRARQGQG